ncbi:MAG: DUF3426 domain-containing protein [Deltaproteobacteria bacterium]
MVIQCDKCQTKFRLDDSKVTGKGIKVRCTKCQNVFVVAPPEPQAQPETLSTAPDAAKETVAPPSPSQGEMSFSGGLQPPPDRDIRGQAPTPPTEEEKKDEAGFSFGTEGFGFGAGDETGKKAGEDEQSSGFGAKNWSFEAPTPGAQEQFQGFGDFGQADEGHKFGDMDIKAGTATGEPQEKPQIKTPKQKEGVHERIEQKPSTSNAPIPASEDWGIKPAEDTGALNASARLKPEAKPLATVPEATTKKSIGELTDEEFAAALSKDEKETPKTAVPPIATRKKPLLLLIAAAIIAALGSAAYFSGILDTISVPTTQTAGKNNVVIESMKGYTFDGKNIGRVFVVEARLKNISAESISVKDVKATIYDAKGAPLATAPGRIISAQDIANLTKDDLARSAKRSLTVITAKGSIPVVAIFAAPPTGMAEFGIDMTL